VPGEIRVSGLREFNRALRQIDRNAPNGVKVAGNRAAQIIVDQARPLVPVGPPAGGHARTSIRVASTRTAARIRAGGRRFPYYPWLDFGGAVGRRDSVRRPFYKDGRYIYPTYYRNLARVQGILRDELAAVARSAGLRVRIG